jgi:hypothetical protein
MEAVRTRRLDTYSVRYLVSGCVLVLGVVLLAEYGRMRLSLIVSFAVILWIICALVGLGVSLARRHWRMTTSILAAPIVVVLVGSLARFTDFSADKARLLVWKGDYLAEMAKREGGLAGIQIGVWPWRNYSAGLLAGSPEEVAFLVYDSSDQIMLPRQRWTEEWLSNADKSGYNKSIIIHPEIIESQKTFDKTMSIQKIGTHFYVVSAEL